MNVWVTGASRGIGRATALRFAQDGHTVFASSRSALSDDLIAEAGEALVPVVCDVTDQLSIERAYRFIAGRVASLDVLINNAGVTVFTSFLETSTEEFDAILDTNLRGVFLLTKAVLPDMIGRKSGTIVMLNSMASRDVFRNSSVYAASKAGLKMLADCLRKEVRGQGIRIISVHPGATETEMWPETLRREKGHAMMRPGQIAEIIFQSILAPDPVLVEDIYLQPIQGAL